MFPYRIETFPVDEVSDKRDEEAITAPTKTLVY